MTRSTIQELIDRHGAFAAATHAQDITEVDGTILYEVCDELREAPCSICLLDLFRFPHMHTIDAHGKVRIHG